MAEITSDTYTPIVADGNNDIINLMPGKTYIVKVWGTFQTTTLDIQVLMPDGSWEALDDGDAAGITGAGVTEFLIVVPHTAIRIVAANTGTAPDIDFLVVGKRD